MPNINTFQKYLSELLVNPNNTLVNNCSHCIKKVYNNTIISVNRIGYNFKGNHGSGVESGGYHVFLHT